MRTVLLLLLSLNPIASFADSAHIAVASNFTQPMKSLIKAFEQQSPHNIKASYASSGKLYAQIHQGAPFDILMSADQDKAIRLVQDDLALADSRFTYALGQLALWSNKSKFKSQEKVRLQSAEFNKLAIANPKLAPYGLAAQQVMQELDITLAAKSLIQGENISQTFQFVATHSADLGFVALSQVLYRAKQDPAISYWQVPVELYNPIKQDLVLLKAGSNNAAAKDFIQFIRTKRAQGLIHAHGYGRQTP